MPSALDVGPHVEFGPVGQREHAQRLAGRQIAVVEVPEFRPLPLRVPAMAGAAHREHPLLGARTFLVAPRAADRHVVFAFGQRLLQRVGLHHLGVDVAAVVERIDVLAHALGVGVDPQIETEPLRGGVAEGDHVAELPRRIDVQQREWRLGGEERLERQVQQDRGVLADRVEHHRAGPPGRQLPAGCGCSRPRGPSDVPGGVGPYQLRSARAWVSCAWVIGSAGEGWNIVPHGAAAQLTKGTHASLADGFVSAAPWTSAGPASSPTGRAAQLNDA